jgi:hypothetical protein
MLLGATRMFVSFMMSQFPTHRPDMMKPVLFAKTRIYNHPQPSITQVPTINPNFEDSIFWRQKHTFEQLEFL